MKVRKANRFIGSDRNYSLMLVGFACDKPVPTSWTSLWVAGAPVTISLFNQLRIHRGGRVLALTGVFNSGSWTATPSMQFRLQKLKTSWTTMATTVVYNPDFTEEVFDEFSTAPTFAAGDRLRLQIKTFNETLTIQAHIFAEVETIKGVGG